MSDKFNISQVITITTSDIFQYFLTAVKDLQSIIMQQFSIKSEGLDLILHSRDKFNISLVITITTCDIFQYFLTAIKDFPST